MKTRAGTATPRNVHSRGYTDYLRARQAATPIAVSAPCGNSTRRRVCSTPCGSSRNCPGAAATVWQHRAPERQGSSLMRTEGGAVSRSYTNVASPSGSVKSAVPALDLASQWEQLSTQPLIARNRVDRDALPFQSQSHLPRHVGGAWRVSVNAQGLGFDGYYRAVPGNSFVLDGNS